jgi:formylmethanofuran dehydrogenase subunit B
MTQVKSVVCPTCGCLCDDIELTIKRNKIVKVKNGCALCEAKMVYGYKSKERIQKPLIRKNGKLQPVTLNEAIHKAAQIITDAKYPLLYGWGSTSTEAQKIGLQLAEEIGAAIDSNSSLCHGPSLMAMQEVGIPTCTLGQVRHRADLIIYWGCNPWVSHPRHFERYTAFTEGRFQKTAWKSYLHKLESAQNKKRIRNVENRIRISTDATKKCGLDSTVNIPKLGRKIVVFDTMETMTAKAADYFIQVQLDRDYDIIEALRCIVNDQELDVDSAGGVPIESLREIAELMVNCTLGVIFLGLGLTKSVGAFRNSELAISLVEDLNRKTKFLAMPMRGTFNVTGANNVFAWQSGYPYAIDFTQGYPQYNPGENTVADLLKRGDNDATLVISDDPSAHFPVHAIQKMVQHPLIVISPDMNCTARLGDVVIPTQWYGIECAGTAYRMDHVPISLQKIVEPPKHILNDEQILQRILEEVRLIKTQNTGSTQPKNCRKTVTN